MNKKKIIIILVVIATVSLGVFFSIRGKASNAKLEINSNEEEDISSAQKDSGELGSFPSFKLTNIEGDLVTDDIFNDYKLTIIALWGSTCGPCYGELDALNEIYIKYKDEGINVLGIPLDGDINLDGVKKAIDSLELDFDNIVPDEEFIGELLKITNSTPTALFVNKDGNFLLEPKVGSYGKEKDIKIFTEIITELTSSEN